MLSRVARLPRICVACRFGLTQRSASQGFRAAIIREGLGQRRRFASDIGKTTDKIENFISDQNNALEKSLDEIPVDTERTETTTKSEDATSTAIHSSTPETISETTQVPQEQLQDEESIPEAQSDAAPPSESLSIPIDFDQLVEEALLEEDENQASRQSPHRSGDMDRLPILPDFDSDAGMVKKKFRHDLLHDESLGVSALGAPADAIIINNPNRLRRLRKGPSIIKPPSGAPPDIEWRRLNRANEPSKEEVLRNITELRPDRRILRYSEIEKLVQALCDGFTGPQLRQYLNTPFQEPDPSILNYPWIKRQSMWKPLEDTPVWGHTKQAYAMRVILTRWRITIQEHVNDLGEIVIVMEPKFFAFLWRKTGGKHLMRELRKTFLLDANEQILLSQHHSQVKIIAKRATAYGIVTHLDQVMASLKSQVIPLGDYSLSSEELIQLAEITGTCLAKERNKLRIIWTPEPDELNSYPSDRADVVARLLMGRPSSNENTHVQCIPPLKLDTTVNGHFVEVQRSDRALAWRDKLRKWMRVVSPIRESDKSNKASSAPLELPKSTSLPEYSAAGIGYQDVTTATFGHLLHHQPHTSIADLARSRRVLSPVIPHPASFSALKSDDNKPLARSSTITLHLASDMGHGDTNPPEIRIHLPIRTEADLAEFTVLQDASAHCVIPWHVDDVMLPNESVDVRLQHERLLPLEINQPGLNSFLKNCDFNISEGRLQTPRDAELLIPDTWLDSRRGNVPATTETSIFYTFRGLEINQTIEMPWRGHTLRYSSIEAGQHGGQRQELILRAGSSEHSNSGFQSEERESFLKLVEEVATGQCFSWTEGYKSIKHRQLEDFSYDLPEEELTDDIIVDKDKFDERGRLNLERYAPPKEPGIEHSRRSKSRDQARGRGRHNTQEDIEQPVEPEFEVEQEEFSDISEFDDVFPDGFGTHAGDESDKPKPQKEPKPLEDMTKKEKKAFENAFTDKFATRASHEPPKPQKKKSKNDEDDGFGFLDEFVKRNQ
ncbi:hypothetical protein FDECE_18326 [Fusarium decemcellulare]|nr:hypothetical protein FDECE_18326 [Fusarium decemcellulare]